MHTGEHPAQRAHGFMPKLSGKLALRPDNGLELGAGRGIFGFATDKIERVQGKSGAEQLVLVDEASGYPEHLFAPLIGNLAGGGKFAMTSNPTQLAGTFYDAFQGKGDWKLLHYDSRNTPNFHGGSVLGLATPKWEAWARSMWGGPGNATYDVRVLGDFPSQDSSLVVTLAAVEAAKLKWFNTPPGQPVRYGLDCSRDGGDESILAAVRGQRLYIVGATRGSKEKSLTGPLLAGWAVGKIREDREAHGDDDSFKAVINVDATGLGTSCFDALTDQHSEEVVAVGIISGESAEERIIVAPGMTAADVYFNLRSQMMFELADFLRDGGALDPSDELLDRDLTVAHYGFDRKGRRQVESKDEIKKRLNGRSPDRGDGAALAVHVGALREVYQSIRGPARRASTWSITG